MSTIEEFMSLKRIAIAGVRSDSSAAANAIYRKFRDNGYQVFAINPNLQEIEGDTCYPDLNAIPDGVEGVFIYTRPEISEQLMQQAVDSGVQYVWMHNGFFPGSSVSEKAVAQGRDNGLKVIDAGCPLMFLKPDIFHRCMRFFMRGRLKQ